MLVFEKFGKIPRLSREIVITEKIDGTNGQILIIRDYDFEIASEQYAGDSVEEFLKKFCLYKQDGIYLFAGSKSRWLDTSSNGDNFGFAKWVQSNAEELLKLGEGRHFGEWYGKGIQRGYGLDEKRFTLFNVKKWDNENIRPKCCGVVPILYTGIFDTLEIKCQLNDLEERGSLAVPGYMNPEGIIIYHTASGHLYKKTILNDEKPKGRE